MKKVYASRTIYLQGSGPLKFHLKNMGVERKLGEYYKLVCVDFRMAQNQISITTFTNCFTIKQVYEVEVSSARLLWLRLVKKGYSRTVRTETHQHLEKLLTFPPGHVENMVTGKYYLIAGL